MASEGAGARGGRFQELSEAECWELVSGRTVGRVAWSGSHGPQVLPVNYSVVDDGIVFRTSPYSEIAKALYESAASFQVDDIDEFLHAGWSVLIVGEARHLHRSYDLPKTAERPEPWAPGVRTMYIRIEPRTVTGRRVIGD